MFNAKNGRQSVAGRLPVRPGRYFSSLAVSLSLNARIFSLG
jgi:hypothetical protein